MIAESARQIPGGEREVPRRQTILSSDEIISHETRKLVKWLHLCQMGHWMQKRQLILRYSIKFLKLFLDIQSSLLQRI
jgi:hypothetical protein